MQSLIMEKLRNYKTHKSLFPLIFLFQILSLGLPSSAYTLPVKFFINCGSDADVNSAKRKFTADLNSSSVLFSEQSIPVHDSNQLPDTLALYQTARVFRQNSSYEFEMSINGAHLVRLHFFAFSSPINLSTASFSVSASEFVLLHDFTVKNSSQSPVVKEFLLSITVDKFRIYFIPRISSFAFVNAIEVFPLPESFIPDGAPHISFTGTKSYYQGIHSQVLETIHRINVGGSTVTQDNDTLWRYWVPDDSYLYNPNTAKNSPPLCKLYYQGIVSNYTAPEAIYQTAKEMNKNTSWISNNFNITWRFNVSKNARHFVRVHFCDIVGQSAKVLIFNLYIDSRIRQEINPYINGFHQKATPFYFDFVVDSDNHGIMNITVGPKADTSDSNAYLNGLEIMELMEKSGSAPANNRPKRKRVLLVVGLVIGGATLICILAVVLAWGLKHRQTKPAELPWEWSPLHIGGGRSSHSRVITERTHNGSPTLNLNLGLKIAFVEIQFATNNFNSKLLIGKGGFGNVYKGILRDGTKVAVKRSQPGSSQVLSEFQTEIIVLSKIRHRHLVSLIGYCDERSEMILVYEFMEKGTLRDHLYNSKLPCLSWKQRLEICIGAARGLHYLHEGAAWRIIHRDVKSTNILLDENHVAKVADFGISRLGAPDANHVSTSVKGTFGYLDPEYLTSQLLTEKSDVYSFGVVLLEVLCARPAINPSLPGEEVNLAEWVMFYKNNGLVEEIVDPLINSQISPNSLTKFVRIAEKCLEVDVACRPTMGEVLWDLEYALQLQQIATQREPHEDSLNDISSGLPLPKIKHLPSFHVFVNKDSAPILSDQDNFISSESKILSTGN